MARRSVWTPVLWSAILTVTARLMSRSIRKLPVTGISSYQAMITRSLIKNWVSPDILLCLRIMTAMAKLMSRFIRKLPVTGISSYRAVIIRSLI